MEKSWISFLLPKDEYKEKKVLYFIAESMFLFLIFSIFLIFIKQFTNSEGILLFLLIPISISSYILIRYIFSGIEYVNVFDINIYKKELKKMISKAIKFSIIFALISIFLKVTDIVSFEWSDILGVTFIALALIILMNYISLRISFKKNLSNK